MITRDEVENMLHGIKDALGYKTDINGPRVSAWYDMLERHKTNVITQARKSMVLDYEGRTFPKPAEFKQYLTEAYNQDSQKEHQHDYDRSDTLHENSARVRKLMETSQRNIDAITKDTPQIQCAKCDKNALRNLGCNDYFEYSNYMTGPTYEAYKGKHLCSEHTQDFIDYLARVTT